MDINQAYEMRSTVARWFEAELMAGLFKIRIIESPTLLYNVNYETYLLSREIPNINLANLRMEYQRFIPRLFVEDLQGTGYNSPLHRKGVSTTLFNALLVLLAREW